MAAVQRLSSLLGIKAESLSREESKIFEADLFVRVCEELKEIIKNGNRDYWKLLKFNDEQGDKMVESNLIRCVINDILSTEEYTLSGIAYYTNIHEDVIYEIATGQNDCPTLIASKKIIELHRSVRSSLYDGIMKKVISNN